MYGGRIYRRMGMTKNGGISEVPDGGARSYLAAVQRGIRCR